MTSTEYTPLRIDVIAIARNGQEKKTLNIMPILSYNNRLSVADYITSQAGHKSIERQLKCSNFRNGA